jgi:hypothetical protein
LVIGTILYGTSGFGRMEAKRTHLHAALSVVFLASPLPRDVGMVNGTEKLAQLHFLSLYL